MSTKQLTSDLIENYFSNINSLAKKIHSDITETKVSYEHIWNELKLNEQIEIINETLIKPEISLHYFDNFSISSTTTLTTLESTLDGGIALAHCCDDITRRKKNQLKIKNIYKFDGKNLKTYSIQKTGLKKLIIDQQQNKTDCKEEEFFIVHDEHSLPFSYKTKSQINLNLFINNHEDDLKMNEKVSLREFCKARNFDEQSEEQTKKQILNQNNKKYQRLFNNTNNNDKMVKNETTKDETGTNKTKQFLTKFICKNDLIFSNNNNKPTTATTNDNKVENLINKYNFNCNHEEDDEANGEPGNCDLLIRPAGDFSVLGGGNLLLISSLSLNSDNYNNVDGDESSKLLTNKYFATATSNNNYPLNTDIVDVDDLCKGFDFLNNW